MRAAGLISAEIAPRDARAPIRSRIRAAMARRGGMTVHPRNFCQMRPDRHHSAARSIPPRRVRGPDLIADAAKYWQGRIARESRIRLRELAQAKGRSPSGFDDPRVPTCVAQTGRRHGAHVAERVGFEPTKSFDSALFKSAAINRSATSPRHRITVEGMRPAAWRCRLTGDAGRSKAGRWRLQAGVVA